MRKTAFPKDLPGRLELVGTTLYGSQWRRRLAAGLRIGRATLHGWMTGAWEPVRDVDGELIALLDSERDAAAARGLQIASLRRMMIGARANA
ncbi:hypothetical protein WHZ77_06010 [Bradyrhizobium sp. A5]|uniref:hypothetical protein n=1 Tax=Bradyrhizobium sp. A5 TaxID=3133696 RepID=UPI0032533C0B